MQPPAGEPDELEQKDDEEPEEDARPQAPQRRQQRYAAAPQEGEEVHGCREERQQRGDEHDLDRPAVYDPRPEPDVRRGSLRELESLVERREELLRGAANLGQAGAALRRL